MASRTFTWNAGDGTSAADWTVAANWTGVGSGYPGDSVGTHVDTVIIPTGKDKCYVNVAIVIYDLTLDGVETHTLVELQANLEVTHDLLITSGIMNLGAGSYTLTVGGDLTLNPVGAGTSTDATLICGNADVSAAKLETSGEWYSGGYTPKAVFTGGTGDHTFGIVYFLPGTDVVLSSGVTEVTGLYFRTDVNTTYNTYDNGDGTVKFTSASNQLLYSASQAADAYNTFYNLILEKTTSTLQGLTTVGFHIKVENDLTITSGILNTNTTSDPPVNHDLTVGGKTTISSATTAGTLTLNGSTCLFNTGGTAGGLELNANATVTSDAGSTVTMGSIIASYDSSIDITLAGTNVVNHYQSSTDKIMKLPPGVIVGTTTSFTITTKAPATNCEVSCADDDVQNLTFTPDSATATQYNLDSGYGGINIAGNLTLNEGTTINGNNQPIQADNSLIIGNGATLLGTNSVTSLGNVNMQSGSAWTMSEGTTTVTNNGGNDTGRTWFSRTNGDNPGARTLTIPSGSTLLFSSNCTFEFDNSQYFYNITVNHMDTKNSHLHIDNDFSASGWGPNGYAGYWLTVGNNLTIRDGGRFNTIDTGSTWTISGNVTLDSGSKWDIHGTGSGGDNGDVNVKIYGNLINNGGYIY